MNKFDRSYHRNSFRHLSTAFPLSVAVFAAGPTLAQDAYPNKPVKIVVGLPAGSFTDLNARWIGDELAVALRTPFVIENRPGGATNVATVVVARAPADGYTLLLATSSNTLNESLFKTLSFDVTKDFKPVAMIASSPFLILANPSFPADSLQGLIKYAKDHPERLNVGAGGYGTAIHLAAELFAQRADVKLTTVFYKSSVETMTDLLGGRIQLGLAPLATGLPHVQAGTLKALGITSAKRSDLAPNIPTVAEAGIPGYDVAMWTGLFAPIGTPSDIVDRLSTAAVNAISSETLQSKIKQNGADPRVMGTKEFSDFVRTDVQKWAEAVKASGVKAAD